MRNKYLYLALSVISLVIELSSMFAGDTSVLNMFEGAFKGLAGVFFIIYYIFMLMGKEPVDKTTH